LIKRQLPDPYFDPQLWWSALATAALSWTTGTLVASANRAMYLPQMFPVDCVLYSLSFYAGNGTGNYDLGVYNDNFVRLVSTGSTAMSAAGVKTLSLPDFKVAAGTLLFAALALSSTSGTILRVPYTTSVASQTAGCGTEDSALPLPSTATPVLSVQNGLPIVVWGVR